MSKHSGRGKVGSSARTNRTKKSAGLLDRRLCFESVEQRRLLSTVGLSSISNVTIPAGSSVMVALNGSDTGNTVKFGVTSSNPTQVTPALMPSTNKSVQFNIAGLGEMTFQLFDNLTPNTASHIETLVNDGFYNGDYIYRAQNGFVVQGGNNPPQISSGANVNSLPTGVPSTINEEFNPDLNYTTAGDLSMARTSTANTSGTEFFITEAAAQNPLDYSYTLFGFQTLNQSITYNGQQTTVLQAIQSMPTESTSGFSYLTTPIKITSASIITDTQNGVLMLRAPAAATVGSTYTVNVTAYDGTNTPTTKSFTVTIGSSTSGSVANPWASSTPATPTSVAFEPTSSSQGTTSVTSLNNSSGPEKLKFQVNGATSGDLVTIYANGVAIGSNVVGSPAVVTTDGATTLPDGTYTITATETAQNVSVTDSGDSSQTETANVDSLMSPGAQLQVVTSLAVTSTPATTAAAGTAYSYTVATNAPSGDTITVTPGTTLPSGMTFNASTQTFSWTPTTAEAGTNQSYTYTVTDAAGNSTALQTVNVAVSAPTLTVTSGALATTATVGKVYSYTVTTGAASGDTISVAAASGTTLPSGMTVSGQTVTWTPTAAQEGTTQPLTLTVTDSTTGGTATIGAAYIAVAGATGLSVIAPPPTIAIGSPELVAFNDTNAGTPKYSVTTSNNSLLTATLLPQTNEVLKVVTSLGEMDFQLLNNYTPITVAHFTNLVNSNTFSSATFYRIIENFMIQGGAGSAGAASTIPVELNPDLRFTTSGLLTMANDGVDGNSSEFFVTGPDDTSTVNSTTGVANTNFSDGFLDFRYTIFGKLIAGDNVRQEIAALPVTTNSAGTEVSQPVDPPTIESMSLTTETTAGVFMLKAASGATGSYTVTVSDGLGGTQNFTVNLGANPYDPPNPWVNPINGTDQITTAANTASTFTPQGVSALGTAVQVNTQVFRGVPAISNAYVDNSYVGTNPVASATNTNITLTQNGSSYTVTPASGFYGVQALQLTAQSATAASWDAGANVDPVYRAYVPVYVDPPAPTITSVTAGGQTVAGSTFDDNSSTSKELTFDISGIVNSTDAITGEYQLEVGTTTTAAIGFDSSSAANTASYMQSALVNAGFTGATVTAATSSATGSLTFNVTFASSEPPVQYVAESTALPVTLANSVTAAATAQKLTFGLAPMSVSVYMDGGTTPIATGTVPYGATTIALTSNGSTKIANGSHSFTVKQSLATSALELYADFIAPSGSFELEVGTGSTAVTTAAINFVGSNMTTTAANIQSALQTAGYSGATVTAVPATTSPTDSYAFKVTFSASQQPITYVSASSSLGLSNFTNSATAAAAVQTLTFVGTTPNDQFSIPATSLASPASAGVNLTIGLVALAPPASIVEAGVPYTYVLQTNAPSGDAVTVTPVTMPAGMQFTAPNTFTWTPTSAQVNTAPAFTVKLSDAQGNTVTIGPDNISVIIGLAPDNIPVNSSSGGNVTVSFSGNQVVVYDNVAHTTLSSATFKSSDTVQIEAPAGQANNVVIMAPTSAGASMPQKILVQGASGATNNTVTLIASGANNTLTLTGGTATANGLSLTAAAVQHLVLEGSGSSNNFALNSSTMATSVIATGASNTLDFSHDTAGVAVNLGLNNGQAQSIAPWGTTLSIKGVINKLIGSAFADTLTGGSAATTEIVSGGGNDKIVGGSGNNILIGGGGSDTLVGGSGKNLLIAGNGADKIYAQGTQNIVFQGTTNYDSNDQALMNLLNQGPLFMYGYSYRRALLAVAQNPALRSSLLTYQSSGVHDAVFDSPNNTWISS